MAEQPPIGMHKCGRMKRRQPDGPNKVSGRIAERDSDLGQWLDKDHHRQTNRNGGQTTTRAVGSDSAGMTDGNRALAGVVGLAGMAEKRLDEVVTADGNDRKDKGNQIWMD